MKTSKVVKSKPAPEKKVQVIKSSIMIPPAKIAGSGMMLIRSRGTTRWQRFKNIVLFAWRYVMTGTARL